MACSANQEQVFSPLDQSGVSNFAFGERKIKKNALSFDQSALSNFALYVIKVETPLPGLRVFVLCLRTIKSVFRVKEEVLEMTS